MPLGYISNFNCLCPSADSSCDNPGLFFVKLTICAYWDDALAQNKYISTWEVADHKMMVSCKVVHRFETRQDITS